MATNNDTFVVLGTKQEFTNYTAQQKNLTLKREEPVYRSGVELGMLFRTTPNASGFMHNDKVDNGLESKFTAFMGYNYGVSQGTSVGAEFDEKFTSKDVFLKCPGNFSGQIYGELKAKANIDDLNPELERPTITTELSTSAGMLLHKVTKNRWSIETDLGVKAGAVYRSCDPQRNLEQGWKPILSPEVKVEVIKGIGRHGSEVSFNGKFDFNEAEVGLRFNLF